MTGNALSILKILFNGDEAALKALCFGITARPEKRESPMQLLNRDCF